MIYYENVGTAQAWKLELRGPVEADGEPISIPFEFHSKYPYIEKEYIAAPSVFDWNGDGIADLMIGGYLTGLIFHYRSVGVRPDGTPELTDAGYLTADGEIIDVGWAAAPACGDFPGTGDRLGGQRDSDPLDSVSASACDGCRRMRAAGSDPVRFVRVRAPVPAGLCRARVQRGAYREYIVDVPINRPLP